MELLTNVQTIKRLLAEYNLRPSRALGQNFLVKESVLQKSVAAAELKPTDTVVEIGAGLGTLTQELAKRAGRVITFEIDRKLLPILRENLREFKNVEIREEDFLSTDLSAVILNAVKNPMQDDTRSFATLRMTTSPRAYKVAANLPYQITSAAIEKLLEAEDQPELMVLMVQKEVAQRICATPGKMSLLSVAMQYYGKPEIVAIVPRHNFWPAPKVDSAILKIVIARSEATKQSRRDRHGLRPRDDKEIFFRLVKAGFSHRRAMLKNNLRQIMPEERISAIFKQLNFNPKIRAQELTVEQWRALVSLWYNQ